MSTTASGPASREIMAVGPGLHSRIVAILKVGLPLVAVAMLAPLFLISTEPSDRGSLIFSRADLAALGSGMRVTEPVFSGETAASDRFRFTAETVIPDAAPPTKAQIETLAGEIDFADGRSMRMSAARASLDLVEERMALFGPVKVTTDDGYDFAADRVDLDLDAGGLTAEGKVTGAGPMGDIAAARLTVSPPSGPEQNRMISFDGGVRLVYAPPRP